VEPLDLPLLRGPRVASCRRLARHRCVRETPAA
jgi:hypothetical protein